MFNVGSHVYKSRSFYLWGDIPALMPPGDAIKNWGGSWFAIGSPGQTNVGQNPDGRNIRGFNFHEHEKTGKPGRSMQSAAVAGLKVPAMASWDGYGKPGYKPQGFNVTAAQRYREGTKNGNDWFGSGKDCSLQRRASSRSYSRKAASAQIAKIPFPLAQHIARVFKPEPGQRKPLLESEAK